MIIACRPTFVLARHLSRGSAVIMAGSRAISTSSHLKTSDAQLYSSMEGKLDSSLLESITDVMGFKYMTPVQDKVLNGLPTLKTDWYVHTSYNIPRMVLKIILSVWYEPRLEQEKPPRFSCRQFNLSCKIPRQKVRWLY